MKTTEIFSSDLPVGEKLSIRRTRFESSTGTSKKQKRISIVSGIHGDELEGQLVIYLLADWLNKNSDKLKGIVDIYPAVNSLGVDTITRGFPMYEVDLNRAFPGSPNEFLPGQVVYALAQDVKGSNIAIDIHSSNIFLREIPQIRINKEYSKSTLPLAKIQIVPIRMSIGIMPPHKGFFNFTQRKYSTTKSTPAITNPIIKSIIFTSPLVNVFGFHFSKFIFAVLMSSIYPNKKF